MKAHLEKLRRAYENPDANAIYPMMDAVMAYATLGEIMQVGREIFGALEGTDDCLGVDLI